MVARVDPTRKGVSVYTTNPRGPNHEQELVIEEPYGSIRFNGLQGALVDVDGLTTEDKTKQIQHQRLTFDEMSVAMVDAGAAGSHGSQKLLDLPAGLIEIVGCIVNLTTEKVGAGITDTAALVGAIGTAAVSDDNATLLTTEADIHPSIAGTLVGGEGTLAGKVLPTLASVLGAAVLTDNTAGTADNILQALADGVTYANDVAAIRNNFADLAAKVNAILAATSVRRLYDGTVTAKDVFLNLAIPDAGSTADAEILVSGTIDLLWVNHGDL